MFRFCLFFFLLLCCLSCEQSFAPEISTEPSEIVVEGYIEGGQRPLPPYVILSKSLPFFSRLGTEAVNNLFVHDAVVRISDGSKTVELEEFCLSELSPEQREVASGLIGIDLNEISLDICIYTDPSLSMFGEVGKTYTLEVEAENKILTSTTTIPLHVPLDSLRFFEPLGEPNDTLVELRGYLKDPADQPNFYRYFTKTNDGNFKSPFASVADDRLFDGLQFEFPLPNAEVGPDGLRPSTYGFFHVGDTVTIRWISLDEPHYEFWNTLEFNKANQGPFSSYTRIKSNIEGGLGIWGGFSASYYELVAE